MKLFFLIIMTFLFSCSPESTFQKDKAQFDTSAVQLSFRSVADMNDANFVIKENNFFEFYRELFDSVKNTRYPGKYTMSGDTLILKFYHKKGYEILGSKAIIAENKKEIIFFK